MTILDLHDEPNSGDAAAAAAADAAATAAAANPDPAKATVPGEGEGKGADAKAGDAAAPDEAAKAAADKAAADAKTAEDKAKAAAGAPEAYAAFQLPEGYVLEGERATQATALFKELNLPQAQAQKLIDAFVKADGENASLLTEMIEGERAKQVEDWGTQTKAALGDKYDVTVADARRAIVAIEPDKAGPLHTAFNELGWGNHPELVKAFAFFGKRITGDSMEGLGGETAQGRHASTAEKLYGKT